MKASRFHKSRTDHLNEVNADKLYYRVLLSVLTIKNTFSEKEILDAFLIT